jgi:hypothetical protein
MESHTPPQPAVAQVPLDTRLPAVGWRARHGPHPAWLALAAVIAFGLVQNAVRYHNYHLGLHGDDYGFLLEHHGLNAHTLLQPYNENLAAFAVLLYRAVLAVVGVRTAVPYIALNLFFMCACAVLAYVFVRRELGPWIALIVPLVLMTLGPAAELILASEFSLFAGLAFWLGGMLLIQRGGTRTDAIGCALLVLGLGCHSIVVALLPATALAMVLWTGWRRAWRRAWIVALPLVLYLAWYEVYHPSVERNLAHVPGFIVNSFVATVEDLLGIVNAGNPPHPSSYGAPLAAVLFAVICARCLYLRRVPQTTLYMGVGLLTIWIAAGLSTGVGRVPAQSRYQFHNSLLLMVALAPLLPRLRSTPRLRLTPRLHLTPRLGLTLMGGALLVVLVGAIVASNLDGYGSWERILRYQESLANAQLAAVEIARPAIVDPGAVFTNWNERGLYWPFTPRAYFEAVDAHGSPVNVHRDLETAIPEARAAADEVLLRVEELSVLSKPRSGTVRPRSVSGVPLEPAGAGCAVIPAGAASAGFEVVAPPGGLIIRPDAGPRVGVGVARFSIPPEAIPLKAVLGGSESERIPPHDSSSVPWRFRLTAAQRVTVCSGAR